MLEFRPLTLADRDLFIRYAAADGYRNCEMCFVDLYIWRFKYQTELCERDGFLYIRCRLNGNVRYFIPLGAGDLSGAVRLLWDEARGKGRDFAMIALPEEAKDKLERAMPGTFSFSDSRDSADYLYNASDLISLAGRDYHSKRNFISRFKTLYQGRYAYEPITGENMGDVWIFQREWCRKNDCHSQISLMEEQTAISIVLDNFEKLQVSGGLLRLDGRVIAFTTGAPITADTFGIQVEKADYEIPGAYPMINREFAAQNCAGYRYINREEDMGIEGLRRAKLSYHPVRLISKYEAVPRDV